MASEPRRLIRVGVLARAHGIRGELLFRPDDSGSRTLLEQRSVVLRDREGRLDERETINKAMESFTNEDFGGIVPPVTYTKTSHEASFRGRIVQVREDGSFKPLTDFYTPGTEKIRHLK